MNRITAPESNIWHIHVSNITWIPRVINRFFKMFFILFIFLFMATPEAYVSSQARGRIRAAASAYATAMATPGLSHIWDLHHSLWQYWILNPLSEAGIKPASLQTQHQFLKPLSHNRNSFKLFFREMPRGAHFNDILILLESQLYHFVWNKTKRRG